VHAEGEVVILVSSTAVYDLALYPVINAFSGIERGLFCHDAFDDEFRRLSGPNSHLNALVDDAYTASGIPWELGVLIDMAVRPRSRRARTCEGTMPSFACEDSLR